MEYHVVYGLGGVCFLSFLIVLVAVIVYVFSRGSRRRQVPSRRTAFDLGALREQIVENIIRDATARPPESREQPVKQVDPKVPKNAIYIGLVGLILLPVIVVALALAATQRIEDSSVARTAILSIAGGSILLVAIVGVVVIVVARMMLRRPGDAVPEEGKDHESSDNRIPTPHPAAARPVGPRQCPACASAIPDDSPEGLCPKCLLGRCLQTPDTPVHPTGGQPTDSYAGPSPAPPAADLATRFPGLEIQELLGQGGMGAVYKARQTKLDRTVAVKILPADWGKDPAFAERFAREARALARLSHPHVVAVHDFGESDGQFYLVMEYVDGANLRNILANGGLEPHEALAIVPQICDALQYAHEEGIVHRDIKPENILLDSKGRVKIADFGLAKLIDKPRAAFTLTGSQQVMGTLDYMAPEQRLTPQQVDHRADIYSLGVVFYEMLTGELPLGRFAPPSRKSGVDARLDGIVFRALEREPEQRYQRISEMKTDLRAMDRAASSPLATIRGAERPRSYGESEATRRIQRISILLVVLAILGWLSVPVYLLIYWETSSTGNPLAWTATQILAGVAAVSSSLISLSAWRAWQRRNYDFVVLATILSMLPWSVCFLVAAPIGYAILRALSDPGVRAAFAFEHRRNFRRGDGRKGQIAESEARGSVLSIPIKLGSLSERRYPGMLRLDEDALVLEYMTGYVRAKIKEARIQINHLRLIRLTHGWFSTSLVLQTASLKSLEGIPNCAQGRLVLSISRKDQTAAERLVRAIQQRTSAVEVESPPAPPWREVEWLPTDSPGARPYPAPAPQPTGPIRRKLRSLFGSVYTMFFSRAKNPEQTTNNPAHEHPAGQP